MRIVICEQEKVKQYHLGVATVMDVLGHSGYLVTDLSDCGDFIAGCEDEGKLYELSRLAGRAVGFGDYIWEVGKWIEGA